MAFRVRDVRGVARRAAWRCACAAQRGAAPRACVARGGARACAWRGGDRRDGVASDHQDLSSLSHILLPTRIYLVYHT